MDLSIAGGQPFILSDQELSADDRLPDIYTSEWSAFRIGSTLEDDLLGSSLFPQHGQKPEQGLVLPVLEETPLPDLKPTYFAIPDDLEELPNLDGSQISTAPSITDEIYVPPTKSEAEEEVDNLWTLPEVISEPHRNQLLSWDNFTNPEHKEPRSAYLSEAGNQGFDLAVRIQRKDLGLSLAKNQLQQTVLITSIFELGLGRESQLYRYEEETHKYVARIEDTNVFGFTPQILESVVAEVEQHGLLFKSISQSLRSAYSEDGLLRTRLAFNSAVSTCLLVLEQNCTARRGRVETLLEVAQIFMESLPLLVHICKMLDVLSVAQNDGELISNAIQSLEDITNTNFRVEAVLQEIVRRTALPWLHNLLKTSGIRIGPGDSLIINDEGINAQDALDAISHPLSPEGQSVFNDCVHGLDLLRISDSRHPTLKGTRLAKTPNLETSWDGIEEVRASALLLRQSMESNSSDEIQVKYDSTIENLSKASGIATDLEDLSSNVVHGVVLQPPSIDEKLLNLMDHEYKALEKPIIVPSLRASIEASIVPLISAQNWLVQRSCLQLLFDTHRLRSHLSLQQQYHLLGNGDFMSRLSSALFDPNLSSGERRSARARTTYSTGLRLETRDTWPPATHELRLVIMGILTESYQASGLAKRLQTTQLSNGREELPGNLSFSIRQLSDSELELCRDAHNIEALDFLRIGYRPNDTLKSVVTEKSLLKYDQLFKHLLRLLRVQQVTQSMARDLASRHSNAQSRSRQYTRNAKLRIDMHRFISGLFDYTMGMGIGQPWRSFDLYLEDVEKSLQDGIDSTGQPLSVGAIRERHERTLDSIMDALFLSKKYRQVKDLIDDILRVVLRFSATLQHEVDDEALIAQREQDEDRFRQEFHHLCSRLCAFLKQQADSSFSTTSRSTMTTFRSDGHSHEVNEGMMAERLLLRLDFSGYFG